MCAREGGGWWEGCVDDFAVRLRLYHFFLFLAFEFTEGYEVRRRRIPISLPPHWMIYFIL